MKKNVFPRFNEALSLRWPQDRADPLFAVFLVTKHWQFQPHKANQYYTKNVIQHLTYIYIYFYHMFNTLDLYCLEIIGDIKTRNNNCIPVCALCIWCKYICHHDYHVSSFFCTHLTSVCTYPKMLLVLTKSHPPSKPGRIR